MNVVYLKLVTGEDIIAFADYDDEYVNVYKPIMVHTKNTSRGAVLRSTQWIPFTDQHDFPIKMSNVVIIATPSEDMKEYYHETLDVLDDMTIEKKNQWELHEEDEETFKAYYELYANNEVQIH